MQKSKKSKSKWKLIGYDTFSNEFYPIKEFDSEKKVVRAANEEEAKINKDQPASSSGGQSNSGIQDRLFIEDPSGNRKRFHFREKKARIRSILTCENHACNASYIQNECEVVYEWEDSLICPQCGEVLIKKSQEYIDGYESHLWSASK